MIKDESRFFDIGQLDMLAARDSIIHRLDPRAKVLITMIFILVVVSFGKYEISQLLPFFVFPTVIIFLADLPFQFFLKKVLVVSPFVLFVGVFNPFLDREILVQIGTIGISGGWLSFFSIILRFILSVCFALILVATTGLTAVCVAFEKLGIPRIFVMQLLFLHRYIFLLVEEGLRMYRARALRTFNNNGMRIKVFTNLVGNLLLRTLNRAQRIHLAMLCRGFTGEIRLNRNLHMNYREIFLVMSCGLVLIIMRLYNIPQELGQLLLEIVK